MGVVENIYKFCQIVRQIHKGNKTIKLPHIDVLTSFWSYHRSRYLTNLWLEGILLGNHTCKNFKRAFFFELSKEILCYHKTNMERNMSHYDFPLVLSTLLYYWDTEYAMFYLLSFISEWTKEREKKEYFTLWLSVGISFKWRERWGGEMR